MQAIQLVRSRRLTMRFQPLSYLEVTISSHAFPGGVASGRNQLTFFLLIMALI